MTARRSERPTPGKITRSTPSPAKAGGNSRSSPSLAKTPGRAARRASAAPPGAPKGQSFDRTWPLFGNQAEPAFPTDPQLGVHQLAPPSADLAALAERPAPPDTSRELARERKRLHAALPGAAPEWLRAAHALGQWLEARVNAGTVEAIEQAAIARVWAAFCLGGVSESQILRVAHLVQRAHTAIRETPRGSHDLQAAYHAAAGVLHAGLPSLVRARMPLERSVAVVRHLRDEADEWTAIVEGTCELLGWNDYARVHAASAIRAVLERSRSA
jgi:hypothetical protein